jgi:hypothetical protein
METANVDIRKLQMLNDRINQTIEALNQVRLSVHGLQHSTQVNPNVGWGLPMNQPGAQIPIQNYPVNPMGYGISHTAATDPRLLDPRFFGLISDPRLQDPRFVGDPRAMGGLSHSEMVDPFWKARLLQTFPYATVPYPVTF